MFIKLVCPVYIHYRHHVRVTKLPATSTRIDTAREMLAVTCINKYENYILCGLLERNASSRLVLSSSHGEKRKL